ncbi:prolyl oligopeptidase family serine peptidase [bacterium]|nr:prolyl oligopeptidase family serine peptidase [bacterium]
MSLYKISIFALCIMMFAFFSTSSSSADLPRPGNYPPLTVSDVVNRESVSEFNVSSGGLWAAWVKSVSDSSLDRQKQQIIVSNLENESKFSLSSIKGDSYSPRFSPDDSILAFIKNMQGKKAQIYLYNMTGGDPKKLTSSKTGIKYFKWAGNENIIYLAGEDSTFREKQLSKRKDITVVVADQKHYSPVRLFLINRKTKKIQRLTTNNGQITEFAPSPDGRWIVFNLSYDINYDYNHKNPPRQYLLDLSQKRCSLSNKTHEEEKAGQEQGNNHKYLTEICTGPFVNPFTYKWDSKSAGFYCVRNISSDSTSGYVNIQKLFYFRVKDRSLRKVRINDRNGLGRNYFVRDDGIIVSLADGVRDRIVFARRKGMNYEEYHLESRNGRPLTPLAAGRDSDMFIYLVSDASHLPAIISSKLKRNKLTNRREVYLLNGEYGKRFLARSEVIRWTGALDETVEGILYYPKGFEEGKSFPLIVSLHGGPAGTDMDFFSERWSNYPHMLSARGAFVLKVNYHGSGNYGLNWVESIKGHYYEFEVPDILKGIDFLIKKGLVDPDKIGIMGWSNGSILAIQCCMESDRFKVLCAGAGDVNWTSDYGNCRFGAGFDNAYFGGTPWNNTETYISKSPIFKMEKLLTPTLIMFGTKDTSVPTEQGWEQFRAMQQIGKAPVRFILFPGSTHGPRKLSYQKRKITEELAWFDKYLFKTFLEENEALAPDSPLFAELKKLDIKKSGTLYGYQTGGILVPETANFTEIRIGKFEVTRAQFNEYHSNYKYSPGKGNYPANNISLEQARQYCRWLSQKTGRTFRLPTESEMKRLLESASPKLDSENNLNFWAGYPPNPDEVTMLKEEIEKIEKRHLLLSEVGSFNPAGGKFYDLGGNVSEWVVTSSGEGKAFGLSAVSNPDKKCIVAPAPARYTGFRVCEEGKH